MRARFFGTLLTLLALAIPGPRPAARAQDAAGDPPPPAEDLLAPIAAASRERDSLSVLADMATGDARTVLEEQVWRKHVEIQKRLMAAAGELEKRKKQGRDISAELAAIEDAFRAGWPRYRKQLERREQMDQAVVESRADAIGAQRPAIEARITEHAMRSARMYEDLVAALLAFERLGLDISRQRSFAIDKLTSAAAQIGARMAVLVRERSFQAAQATRNPNDPVARAELEATGIALDRAADNLELAISLLDRFDAETTALKVSLIVTTGKLNTHAFDAPVIAGILRHWEGRVLEHLATRAPRWLFHGLLIALVLVGFQLLSKLTRRMVRKAVARSPFSQLLRDTITSWSSTAVMGIGVLVVLRQFGVELGPMLAGLGIAGFVLGFALQDTLSNFAAGGMILAYQPFDIGDVVEVAGVTGTVRRMSLVSTTILTFDNQALIVPNRKVWGDVIRNITAQATRRVDLVFGVGYGSEIPKVERVLQEIVTGHAKVLKDPAPLIKVHALADSSVQFVVRSWTLTDDYWDVYWDITRAVKLRFDEEGITIPFPQRELHVNMLEGRLPARPAPPPPRS